MNTQLILSGYLYCVKIDNEAWRVVILGHTWGKNVCFGAFWGMIGTL